MSKKLTDQQEAYALAFVANGGKVTEAYIQVCSTPASGWKRSSLRVAASRMRKNPHVAARIDELIALSKKIAPTDDLGEVVAAAKEAAKNEKIDAAIQSAAAIADSKVTSTRVALVTLESHIEELESIRDKALAARQFSAAAKCEELRAKACHLYVERKEISGPNGQPLALGPGGGLAVNVTITFVDPPENRG